GDGGLGLGLYIVRELVEAHGGRVWATSGDDGVEFTMALPRHAAARGHAFRDAGHARGAGAVGVPGQFDVGSSDGATPARVAVLPSWANRVRDPRIAALLARWCELATTHPLPPLAALRGNGVRGWAHEMCVVRVEPLDVPAGDVPDDTQRGPRVVLMWEEVGVALEARLGHPLTGRVVVPHELAADDPLAEWVEDYVEALARRRPAYRYIRLGASTMPSAAAEMTTGSPPGLLERIVLPCAVDESDGVTHLLSLVRFTALETADARRFGEIDADAYP
ncbi:MAG: hypothetical protein MUF21_14070, partial [Gemmatimonadaceae bacterium]|nr:hypothetical protein [Gemmatimonadaceae bacterium]